MQQMLKKLSLEGRFYATDAGKHNSCIQHTIGEDLICNRYSAMVMGDG